MTLPRSFYRLLSLQAGEEKVVGLLFLLSFLLGTAVVFYETTAYSLFLNRYDAETLPYIYMGASILIILCGSVYSWVEERFSFSTLLMATVGSLAVGVVLLSIYERVNASDTTVLIIALWSETINMLTGLVFWSLTGRLLTLRQGKRLFSLVSTGEVTARAVGGGAISVLTPIIGASNLLLFVVGALVACVALLAYINRAFPDRVARSDLTPHAIDEDEDDEDDGAPAAKEQRPAHWRTRYMVLVAGLAGLSLVGYYFVDFLFYQKAEQIYTTEEELASFLGLFFAAVGVVNLTFKTLLAGRLLNRFGMTFGLLLLPGLLLLGALTAYFADWLGYELTVIFALIAITKLFDGVARIAVDEPSVVMLYQPLPVDFRLSAQTRIESVGEPVAAILAAGFLLLLDQVGAITNPLLLGCLTLALIGWISVALLLRKEYWEMLGNALAKRTLGDGVNIALDSHSLDMLTRHLDSPHIGEVLYLVNLLEHENHQLFTEALRTLLRRPEPEIQLDCLERIERLGLSSLRDAVKHLIEEEISPQVRGAALRTYTAVSDEDIFEEIAPYLDHPIQELRQNALVGLLRSGGIEGVLIAGERFYTLANAPDPEQRRLAAQILGEVGIRNFYRPLLAFFDDRYREVRQAAILAAARLHNERLWPPLIASLAEKSQRRTAEQALGIAGPSAVPEMRRTFADNSQPYLVRIGLVRVCALVCSPESNALALEALSDDDQMIRLQGLRALNRCKYRATTEDARSNLQLVAELELDFASWVLVTARDIQMTGGYPLLLRDLRVKLEQIRSRIFLLLALVLNRKTIVQLQKNYETSSKDKHAYTVEMLHKLLQGPLKRLFVLFDDISDNERLHQLSREYPHESTTPDRHLEEIITGRQRGITFWTQCIALYEVGNKRLRNLQPAVLQALESQDKFVRETALWALGQLSPSTLPAILRPLQDDPAPNVRAMARSIALRLAAPHPKGT